MARRPLTTEEKIAIFRKQGWCPVPWSHHPEAIKEILHYSGIRPKMKSCWENCQRVMLSKHPNLEHITYCEGYVTTLIPMSHAWLMYEGEIVDLTLDTQGDETPPIFPQEFNTYTPEEIWDSLLRHECFGPVDLCKLEEVNPPTNDEGAVGVAQVEGSRAIAWKVGDRGSEQSASSSSRRRGAN